MNLRSELLDWLAALPALETPDDRKMLLARTGPASLFLYLDWEGSSRAFAERLLAALGRGGRAASLAFLSALGSLPWLQDDVERRQALAALQARLEALEDADFADLFPPGDGDPAAQEGAADPGMLAAAVAGDVLLPYYVLGASGLEQDAGEPAALLAGQVARAVETALHGDPGIDVLFGDLPYLPEASHEELLLRLRDKLDTDPALARDLAALLAPVGRGSEENALGPLIDLRRRILDSASQVVESAAEPDESLSWELPAPVEEPDESLAWDLPAGDEEEPVGAIDKGPRAEPPREGPPAPAAPSATEPSRPRRPFESLESAEPGDVSVEGDVDVGRDLIGRDQVVHGDQVTGPKYEAGTINIFHGTPDAGLLARPSTPASPLIEEAIRLDVAAPPAATLDLPFDLAVAVRQPGAPTLAVEDLTQVKSQDGTIFRREEEEIVLYRVAVSAAGCDVQPAHYILKLRPRANSLPCWFQLTPHRPGKQSIVVTAYQQDDALAAQTRLSIEVQVPISP